MTRKEYYFKIPLLILIGTLVMFLTEKVLVEQLAQAAEDTQVQDASKKQLLPTDLCNSTWILAGGVALSGAEPAVGVEVLSFKLDDQDLLVFKELC